MSKAATLERNADDKKKKKPAAAAPAVKVKAKTKTKTKTKKEKGAKAQTKTSAKAKKHEGLEGLAKLIDHPLVADLLAAGAIAAVAAIAEHKMGQGQSSSKMVKSAGKAAAAAMGKRLFGDIGAVTGAAVEAAKKA